MPPIKITFETVRLRRSITRIKGGLRRFNVPYGRSARHMRDYVRQTITMQGRNRPYVPLSHWTKARTGRRKALIKLRPLIRARWDGNAGQVFFRQVDSSWHIDQHHTGFISPAVSGKKMVVPSKSGGVLAVFVNRKASKIPAREVWPTKAEVIREVRPIFLTWVEEVARRTWR